MSISGVSSSTTCPPGHTVRTDFQQLRDGFKGIDAALQSGDLDAAKQALDTFKQALQDLQSRRSDNAQPGQKNTRRFSASIRSAQPHPPSKAMLPFLSGL